MKRFTVLTFVAAFFFFAGTSTPIKLFKIETAEAATKAQWRHARRLCTKKYGKRLVKTTINRRGRITCTFRRKVRKSRKANANRSYADVVKFCRKRYKGNIVVNARKKFGKWYCTWRE